MPRRLRASVPPLVAGLTFVLVFTVEPSSYNISIFWPKTGIFAWRRQLLSDYLASLVIYTAEEVPLRYSAAPRHRHRHSSAARSGSFAQSDSNSQI
jgi:hypothetical protein